MFTMHQSMESAFLTITKLWCTANEISHKFKEKTSGKLDFGSKKSSKLKKFRQFQIPNIGLSTTGLQHKNGLI